VTKCVKYLGVMLHSEGKMTPEVEYRISQASLASARLHRVLKLHRLTTTTKLLFYTAMIRSVLLYATEIQTFTDAHLRTFEAFQSRCLRRISVSPSHIHKITNYDIRKNLAIPSITSYLMHKRLRWWKNVCDDSSALYGVRTAIFGNFEWDSQKPGKNTSPRIKLLLCDLRHLNAVLPSFLQCVDDFSDFSDALVKWFVGLPKSRLKDVETPFSSVERVNNLMIGPMNHPDHECPQCHKKFDTRAKCATHRFQAHKYKPAACNAIIEAKCPVCRQSFMNIKNAQNHFIRKCSTTLLPQQIEDLSRTADLHRQHAATSAGSNGSQFIYHSIVQAGVRSS
jgi:hypothetical protein